jgi:hypothetical protein
VAEQLSEEDTEGSEADSAMPVRRLLLLLMRAVRPSVATTPTGGGTQPLREELRQFYSHTITH